MEVSQANRWIYQVHPNTCSPVVLPYLSWTYWEHGHSDTHGCEHRVRHRAALIAQPDAVVIAEESSVVRREGRLVQKHGNKHHCMVGHTSLSPVDIFNRKKQNRKADEDSNSVDIKKTLPNMYSSYASHPVSITVTSKNKHNKTCWNRFQKSKRHHYFLTETNLLCLE